MGEQRFVQAKRLAAIIRTKQRRGIDARQHDLGPERGRGLERPDRIERDTAALGKLDIALGGLVPARAEIVGPAHYRAPMIALVADDNSLGTVADECGGPDRLPEEMRT